MAYPDRRMSRRDGSVGRGEVCSVRGSFSFGGCMSPSHTNAEACFGAAPMHSPTDV